MTFGTSQKIFFGLVDEVGAGFVFTSHRGLGNDQMDDATIGL